MITKNKDEKQLDFIKRIVEVKMINKTLDMSYEDLSELIFGEGNCFNESEVRKRMYGMKYLFELMEKEKFINIANRILSISDTHVPFQLPIETFKDYVGKVDTLQLNGDILDCQSLSKFPKTYRVSMMEEMIEGRQYMIELINYIRPKKVVINYGNHELRYQSYIAKTMGEDMAQMLPQTALDLICVDGFYSYNKRDKTKTWYKPLKDFFDGIEVVYTENWHCQIGDTIFCHPCAYSTAMLKTAERALYWFRNEGYNFKNIVMAHTHRIGFYAIGNSIIYEQGTCSDTKKQTYVDGRLCNTQKEGFIYLCQDKEGNTIIDSTDLKILN